uniref:Acetyltransf_18 domain-containing protein n=1 Tax=Strongyloides venezuelensis TaxID=75913 RepID=A0A0K0FQS6_STRVS
MFAVQDIENLFRNSLSNEALSYSYLPINNNPSFLDFDNIIAVMIVRENEKGKKVPIGYGVTQKITNNQYYVMMNVIDGNYLNKYVSISDNQTYFKSFSHKNLSILSIDNIYNIFNNRNIIKSPISTYFSPYNTVFGDSDVKSVMEILFDETIKKFNINKNFYLSKNMTIDFMYDGNKIGREEELMIMNGIGFNVVDKMYFQKCTHTLETLKISTENAFNYIGECLEIGNDNLGMVIEYDNFVIGINRKDFLEHLFKLGNVNGLIQVDGKRNVIGYILIMNNHILGCYGDDKIIQMNLIKNILPKLDDIRDVTFFLNCTGDSLATKLLENALEIKEIRRHNTLSIIEKINWNKIGIIGIGCHIF